TPCVDRFHIKDINEKIEQLIGLSKDQFSQIVMLPQGEFRKLLTSETENKEEILRRIFNTGLYQRFNERLKEKRQNADQQYKQYVHERRLHTERVRETLPLREASILERVFDQAYYNPHQVIDAL